MDEAIEIDDDDVDGWCVDCDDDLGDVQDDDEWVCRECLVVRYHKLAEDNQRLAAEVERLTPKPMTLQDAINVLNAHAYGDGRWSLDEQYGLFAVDPFRRTLTTYDAVAVAEKLLREKEAKA